MVAIVALMLVVSAAVPLLTVDVRAQEDGRSAMPANDRFGNVTWDGGDQQWNQSRINQLFQSLPDREPLFGPLSSDNGNITGRYISFTVNPDNGTIQNYALNISGTQTPVFNMVKATGFQPTQWNVSGPLFTATNDSLTMYAHDNPMGTFRAAAVDAANVNLSMPAGFTATPRESINESVRVWMISGEGVDAVLVVNNGTVNSNISPSSPGYANVSLNPGGSFVFRALPIAGGFPEQNERFLASQLANWTIVGEMAIISNSNTTFWAATQTGVLAPSVEASKGMVTVNLTPATSMQQSGENGGGGIDLPEIPRPMSQAANTTNQSGQQMWYVIAMDKSTVNPDNGTVMVTVNGHELSMVSSSQELNSSSFWMYQGANASAFVVPIPASNGSVSIVVQEGTTAPNTAAAVSMATVTAAGAAIIGLVAVVGGVVYLRRKK